MRLLDVPADISQDPLAEVNATSLADRLRTGAAWVLEAAFGVCNIIYPLTTLEEYQQAKDLRTRN